MAVPDSNKLEDRTGDSSPDEPTRTNQQLSADTSISVAKYALPLPARVDRYEIRDVLGAGAYGRVFLAFDPVIHREVALKVPGRPAGWSDHDEAEFLKEAQRAARLRHPNVVTIYDAGRCSEHGVFIVMEYIEGQTLMHRLALDPIGIDESVRVVAQVAEAMHAAHKQGLVHRDLKPSNIMLDHEGNAHVTDFGLALLEEGQAAERGMISGTLPYMSPEQITGHSHLLDGRSDLWSLGVVLYQCLTGRKPFSGAGLKEMQEEILRREPKPLRQINDRIPKRLEEICLTCLSKSVSDRFRTGRDLAEALSEWSLEASGSAGSALSAPGGQQLHPQSGSSITGAGSAQQSSVLGSASSSKPLLFAVVSLIVVAIGVGALILGGGLNRGDRDQHGGLPPVTIPDPTVPPQRTIPTEAGRWYSLLDVAPETLVWSPSPDANLDAKPERQQVSVSSSHPAVLAVGSTPVDDFRLEVWISRSAWRGSSGLMWGVPEDLDKDRPPTFTAQVLHINSFDTTTGPEHRVQRDVLSFHEAAGLPAPLMDRHQFRTVTVTPPDKPDVRLEVTVLGGTVQEVRWDGERLESLCDGPGKSLPEGVAARGRICLYNEYGTALFRDARLQLLSSPGSTKSTPQENH